jgi:DNA helicase-2/ATP-dependent DNA helicase PcrA
MDVSHILDPLNDAQRQAVCAPPGHLLVLAGAGSGKTRVLVHRIAWLMEAEQVSPYGLLAVTFTNKAAGEMRGRIEQLLGRPAGALWVGTFHGIAHRLLRAHWQDAELNKDFQILDSEDQQRVIKRVIREMGLDDSQWPAKEAQWYINARKDEGKRPSQLAHQGDPRLRHMIAIYEAYEAFCRRSGLVDFAELLLRAHELWRDRPDILQHYRQRFGHLLVDEFQDTNTIQYAWLRQLAGDTGKLFAVGDDDQSIYGWRGARVENIQQLTHDFPQHTVIRLEQNYRSTANILNAANTLIANNAARMGKNLWTVGESGDPVQIYNAFNEIDEAHFIVDRIRDWVDQGHRYSETAILYRSNAQSRVFEEVLVHAAIPYRVYGGLRFFERQEIKDALAYLRLVANRHDDASLERVINVPTRGVGNRTLEVVRQYARQTGVPLWQSIYTLLEEKSLPSRALNALQGFTEIVERLSQQVQGLDLQEQVEHVVHGSGLREHYQKEKGEKGQARIENLDELISAAQLFVRDDPEDDMQQMDDLSAFLSHAALEAGERQSGEWDDCVQLMTLHSAKGLEFELVFMAGVEEGLFPHQLSVEEPGRLEEERRLCYVGMTRAKRRLLLSYAEKRRLYGNENYTRPSRFLSELPTECTESVRMTGDVSEPFINQAAGTTTATGGGDELALGRRVVHDKFGEGVVLNYEGAGRHSRVQVNFDAVGTKWLMVEYARLRVS